MKNAKVDCFGFSTEPLPPNTDDWGFRTYQYMGWTIKRTRNDYAANWLAEKGDKWFRVMGTLADVRAHIKEEEAKLS